MKLRHNIYAVLLTLPLFALTACDRNTASAPMNATQDSGNSQTSQFDDSSLNRSVSNALLRDAAFSDNSISVTSDKGHITLNGSVASLQDKNRATEIVKEVIGVTRVQNNLEIIMTTSSY
ncbi:BON domain-containing protein [Alkalimonas collagenimarina]|uniref:BON domain-containing protein n=1 Tax=Alkalimonas collagenimarina TaxID=400390 RepID=A0ABT9GY38_9GAMM|nr:BON domain-containing protein [Alkalimonas collagenimarina]MDP4535779.1 BON domain-containing protein [Alkalimonas collagenimarina]